MNQYSAISVIFNPKSTGTSQQNAETLRHRLRDMLPDTPLRIIPTKRAGHAEELAYELATATPHPLILSASGDGGYNEVVNGIMRAQAEGADPVTGVVPSGNANDHYHSVKTGVLEQHIANHTERTIDVLHVTVTAGDRSWSRYAHSYVGIGITANVGRKLNQIALNPVNEWVVTARMIYNSEPAEVVVDGKRTRYDSLIFSNISRLAKVFQLSASSKVDDGQMEVIALPSKNKAEMVRRVARALTRHADDVAEVSQATESTFTTLAEEPMQLDGEVVTLQPNTTVTVTVEPGALRCVL